MRELDEDDLVVPSVAAMGPGAVLLPLWTGCPLVLPVEVECSDTVSARGSSLACQLMSGRTGPMR